MPMDGIKTHKYYQPEFEMFIVVGHSKGLSSIMSESLQVEIVRELWWFYLSLFGGCLICFFVFLYCFERRLQLRVTKPITTLAKQIMNPKEFLKERNKAMDMYGRKNTVRRKSSNPRVYIA